MSYGEKLDKIGPRKLLALDEGAIRGVITLEVLAEIDRATIRTSESDQKNAFRKGFIAMPLLEQMQGEREAEARALEEAKKAISVGSDEPVAAIELNANAISLRVAF